jgi:SPASM domain peptide maturase of grasp-with-spasm system
MANERPFKRFANCQLVKGAERATVCDLQRNRIHLIPLVLFDILSDFDGKTISWIKEYYNNGYDEEIQGYFDFLVAEEIIFFTSFPAHFPQMSLQWHSPTTIQNCILDLDERSMYPTHEMIKSLDNLGCQYLEIRSYHGFDLHRYESIIAECDDTTVTSINLIVAANPDIEDESWLSFCDRHPRVTGLTVHGSKIETSMRSPRFAIPVEFRNHAISSEKCCGIISEKWFMATIPVFTEAQSFNTCLNRKVSVDTNGKIKNCPSMISDFGDVTKVKLEAVISNPEFQYVWNVSKDNILVCKDCEFRYVCTDCRAYVNDYGDDFSKPLKCGYDPYTCQWEEWSINPMKQRVIQYYGLSEISPLPNPNNNSTPV